MAQDLRSALAGIEAAGALLTVEQKLSWEYDLAGVLWKLAHGPTVVFEHVDGYGTSVVGNLLNRRDKLAFALGIDPGDVQRRVVDALRNPIAPVAVADAPCQEVVRPGDTDLLAEFPVPAISERDGGRYISAGVLISRHPESGHRNMAICRLQVLGPGRLGVYMAPTHSRAALEACRATGSSMPVAIALGLHPAIMVASQFLTPLEEADLAGGLFGEPMQQVRGTTVDLDVPAHSEIVLEGSIAPDDVAEEGPFGEFPGSYAPRRTNPVIRLSAVTSRRSPLFQMIVGGRHPEHLITGAIAREAGLFEAIRSVVPGVRQVRLTQGGSCRFHAVVAITKRFAGEGKLAMLTAFTAQDLIKHVVVVDDDIDVDDADSIEWAVATRMRAGEDVVLVPGMKSNPVDQMSRDAMITKMGIDATLPVRQPGEERTVVGVPDETLRRLDRHWDSIVGPGSPMANVTHS